MNQIKPIFTKSQILLFFILTYLLSWWSVPFVQGSIFPYGPALAAIIVLVATNDSQGRKYFLSRITRWKTGWVWYAIGPTIILATQWIAYFVSLKMGIQAVEPPHLPSLGSVVSILIIGGWWEEIGWSGYALPKLQEYYWDRPDRRILAALILGVFRALWHLPLFLKGTIYWFDILIFEIAFQLLIAWVYDRSSGSIPAVMLLHFFSNFIGLAFGPVFAGAARANYYALFMAFESLIAVWIAWKASLALRKPKPETPAVKI